MSTTEGRKTTMMFAVYALTAFFGVLAVRASYVYDQAIRQGKDHERAYTMRGVYGVILLALIMLIYAHFEYLYTIQG